MIVLLFILEDQGGWFLLSVKSSSSGSIDGIDVLTSKKQRWAVLCIKTSPGRMQHTHLLTPDRDTTTDPSTDTTNANLVNRCVLSAVLIGVWMRG